MTNHCILIVDDEQRMRKLIKDFLKAKGYSILEAEDGEKALEIFEENRNRITLILLDVMMPKLDGWSVLRQIRQTSKVPIIMLTARGEEQDELFGFELGVDEYIAKPFSPKILVARVEAILKRTTKDTSEVRDYAGIEIDKEGRTVKIDGKAIELSLREYELLVYLIENENIALSRDKILNNVWNYDYYGDSRTIDSHIKKIRHKLGKRGKYIKTMRGIGYKFEVNEAMSVVDKMTAIDLEAATSTEELATALARTANMANTSGISFEKLLGMIGTVSSVTRRSAETIRRSL